MEGAIVIRGRRTFLPLAGASLLASLAAASPAAAQPLPPPPQPVAEGREQPVASALLGATLQPGGDLLTAEPGPDVAPYHTRGVLPLPLSLWADWLFDRKPASALLAPPPEGTLKAERAPRG